MKIADFVKIHVGLLKFLSDNDVKVDDWRYARMYERFMLMRKEGVKYIVAVEQLADEYGTSRATIERAIKKFNKECK